MAGTREFLRSIGLPSGELGDLPDSAKRFPDGAQYRMEIPSTEGPRCLDAVLEEAERLGVRVHRVSQGSGVFMHTDEELDEMAARAAARASRSRLFTRPNAAWGTSAAARSPAGGVARPRGARAGAGRRVPRRRRRAAEHGFRSVLIADIGVLAAFSAMKEAGDASGGHAGEDLGDAARGEPGRGPGARAGSARARSTCRPTCRSRRSRRSAPPSTARSTSTSRRPTTSAASSGSTRLRS